MAISWILASIYNTTKIYVYTNIHAWRSFAVVWSGYTGNNNSTAQQVQTYYH